MSREDISRTYGRGFIGIVSKDGSKVVPARVLEPVGTNRVIVEYEGVAEEVALADSKLTFDHPDSMMVNLGKGVAWVERMPQRQWHRGIMANLLHITQLQGRAIRGDDVIAPLLAPEYVSIDQAKQEGGAISKNFAIVKRPTYQNYVVYMRDVIVGEVISSRISIPDPQVKRSFDEEVL
jgi:hypothetical protein